MIVGVSLGSAVGVDDSRGIGVIFLVGEHPDRTSPQKAGTLNRRKSRRDID